MKPDLQRLRGLALSETGFVFDPVTGYTYNLNPMATTLLRRLQEGQEPAEVLAAAKTEYDAPADEIDRDFEQFLGRLRDYGLLLYREA